MLFTLDLFQVTGGVYHLHGKCGWNGTLVMVQDFPGMVFPQTQVSCGRTKTITNQNGACICSVERREKRPRRTGSIGSLKQEFSGHFGWNGKRGIRLRISIFLGKFPVE